MILDTTCSIGRKWPAKADIRIDIRREAKPDIVCDAGNLPFRQGSFSEIYCDPPHLLYPGKNTWAKGSGIMVNRFGFWKTSRDWVAFIERTNREFAYVLTKEGSLNYKILDGLGGGTTKLRDLLPRMSNFDLIEDKAEKSRGVTKRSMIHYLVFKPKPLLNRQNPQTMDCFLGSEQTNNEGARNWFAGWEKVIKETQ